MPRPSWSPPPSPRASDVAATQAEAISALDRAAKYGAIHPNAAARRKSRLAKKINAAMAGATVVSASHVAKTTGKAAAVKAAKARIAAGKAVKAKGAQTAAGKARAALSRSTRSEATPAPAAAAAAAPAAKATKAGATKAAPKAAAKTTATKAPAKAAAPRLQPRRLRPRHRAKTTAAKAPAKAAAPKAAAKRHRQDPGREGRPEDDEGQGGQVVLAPPDSTTPRSSTGAFSILGVRRGVRCPPADRIGLEPSDIPQKSTSRTVSRFRAAFRGSCPPGGR